MSEHQQSDLLAAIDLGSNSFHMVIAKAVGDELQLIDRIKEPVRLAAGLMPGGGLDRDSRERALSCLERFGQRLRHCLPQNVRAVGTNTLRAAQAKKKFLEHAQQALGFPIDIIDGHEEARLIYVGVSHSIANGEGRRLVIDIGGGSTECIIGEGYESTVVDSLYMGCVSFTNAFFEDGRITAKRMRKAITAAELELHPIERSYQKLGWQESLGASGTIKAIALILTYSGWSQGGITLEGLEKLSGNMVDAGHIQNLDLPGLQPERAAVLPGGVAILIGVFERLGVETMYPSPGALREGILHELLGRIRHDDLREVSVERICERYGVDRKHALSVERSALDLLEQTPAEWGMAGSKWEQLVGWSARLHEVGLALRYSGYHKHSAYLILNSDMPGFSTQEVEVLAVLVGCHRRKIRKQVLSEVLLSSFDLLPALVAVLRIGVLLNRGRSPAHRPEVELEVQNEKWKLNFEDGWLEDHPLTLADLESEQIYLDALNIQLIW